MPAALTRVLTLGVKEKYRGKGLESAMLIEGLNVGIAAGVRESEASWILEDNEMMCRVLGTIGGRVYSGTGFTKRTSARRRVESTRGISPSPKRSVHTASAA